MLVDHIDRDPSNDRWDNLRLATPALNNRNSRRRSSKWPRGVVPAHGSKGFMARVKIDKKYKYLGTYPTATEASSVVRAYLQELHPGIELPD